MNGHFYGNLIRKIYINIVLDKMRHFDCGPHNFIIKSKWNSNRMKVKAWEVAWDFNDVYPIKYLLNEFVINKFNIQINITETLSKLGVSGILF